MKNLSPNFFSRKRHLNTFFYLLNLSFKLFFLFFLLTLTNCGENGEEAPIPQGNIIYEGDVQLKTQGELNDFGSKGYTAINGSLVIGDHPTSNITSLNNLKSLTEINGNLRIRGTVNLTSLEGLNNVISVHGLSIEGAKELTNIDHLQNLKSIVDDNPEDGYWVSFISGNDKLSNIDGLSNLENYEGVLYIINNKSLVNLDGLKNIISFKSSEIDIRSNENLKSILGLTSVTTLDLLYIIENNNLENLEGLNNLNSIDRTCQISGNTILNDFCSLKKLANNGKDYELFIFNNALNPTKDDLINNNCN